MHCTDTIARRSENSASILSSPQAVPHPSTNAIFQFVSQAFWFKTVSKQRLGAVKHHPPYVGNFSARRSSICEFDLFQHSQIGLECIGEAAGAADNP